ncbi:MULTISPECIES: hypothetical protein [unclassified Clostridium]|uniref:hypothetical protein n=1 Tax=unclassified Clostridium TaxID=2614128 RepID=UPI000297315F|nr:MULTISPECIES: hypothetical protein [unclassified Clostridium]EKQ56325.1 MAG: hypothetical protein A370_02081 [Clostridium sp. Maddingley MBC34-26]
MEKSKSTVTYEERKKVKEKILETISTELEGIEITSIFITTLLKEIVSDLNSNQI